MRQLNPVTVVDRLEPCLQLLPGNEVSSCGSDRSTLGSNKNNFYPLVALT